MSRDPFLVCTRQSQFSFLCIEHSSSSKAFGKGVNCKSVICCLWASVSSSVRRFNNRPSLSAVQGITWDQLGQTKSVAFRKSRTKGTCFGDDDDGSSGDNGVTNEVAPSQREGSLILSSTNYVVSTLCCFSRGWKAPSTQSTYLECQSKGQPRSRSLLPNCNCFELYPGRQAEDLMLLLLLEIELVSALRELRESIPRGMLWGVMSDITFWCSFGIAPFSHLSCFLFNLVSGLPSPRRMRIWRHVTSKEQLTPFSKASG